MGSTPDDLALLDGVLAPAHATAIPVTDEGFLRGYGAFEVIRVYDGRAFAMDDHLSRMARSAANMRLGELPRAELERESAKLLERRGGPEFDGLLRLVLTRGGRRLLMTEPVPDLPARARLACVTYAPTRVLDGIKSLSYGANLLCGVLAQERGFDEALLTTPHGRILEGPTSTFFWVDADGQLCTPPLEDHVLASITRARLMGLLDVEERSATLDDVRRGREAFLASTAREALPVAAIEDHEFGPESPVARQAADAFRAHVAAELGRSAAT